MIIDIKIGIPPPVIANKVEQVTITLNRSEAAVLASIIGNIALKQVQDGAEGAKSYALTFDQQINRAYAKGLPAHITHDDYEGIYRAINEAFVHEKQF